MSDTITPEEVEGLRRLHAAAQSEDEWGKDRFVFTAADVGPGTAWLLYDDNDRCAEFDDNVGLGFYGLRVAEYAAAVMTKGAALLDAAAKLREERDAAHEALRSLACWLSVGGYNAETVDPVAFEQKIRDGVNMLVRTETERARGAAGELKAP